MEHILSLSYGKDSLACLGAIEELGWQLDRIVHSEIFATETISADLPPMVEFKKQADAIIKKRWGITVEHVRSKYSYQERFYKICEGKNEKYRGKITGFPGIKRNWCNSELKVSPMNKIKKDCISYLGIAVDEPSRFHNLTDTKRSPLVDAGWTESDCWEWCKKNDLLPPIYTTATRGGCWFCHNQSVNQLRSLRKNYPEYWALMMLWDTDSPRTFHADGHTVHDFELRFQMEDDGLISIDNKRFRWSMLDQELNYKLF